MTQIQPSTIPFWKQAGYTYIGPRVTGSPAAGIWGESSFVTLLMSTLLLDIQVTSTRRCPSPGLGFLLRKTRESVRLGDGLR